MARSLVKNLVHLVFSTLNREPSLAETIRGPLCAYAAAVLRDLDSPVLASDAWRDHVHVLFSLSKNHPLADVLMQVKRATSKWLKTTSSEFTRFHWQAGYGAFSIGQSALEDTKAYIGRQPEHHRKRTFEQEFRGLMKLYQLEFDERYLWN